jgi:hypothetical protein
MSDTSRAALAMVPRPRRGEGGGRFLCLVINHQWRVAGDVTRHPRGAPSQLIGHRMRCLRCQEVRTRRVA